MFLAYFQSKIEYVPEEERISTNTDEVMGVCIYRTGIKVINDLSVLGVVILVVFVLIFIYMIFECIFMFLLPNWEHIKSLILCHPAGRKAYIRMWQVLYSCI